MLQCPSCIGRFARPANYSSPDKNVLGWFCPNCAKRLRLTTDSHAVMTLFNIALVEIDPEASFSAPSQAEFKRREAEAAAQNFAGAICGRIERDQALITSSYKERQHGDRRTESTQNPERLRRPLAGPEAGDSTPRRRSRAGERRGSPLDHDHRQGSGEEGRREAGCARPDPPAGGDPTPPSPDRTAR